MVNPLSRRNRRKRKEKSKPEGVVKTSFKVRLSKGGWGVDNNLTIIQSVIIDRLLN